MSNILGKVKERGHWVVRILPTDYVERIGLLAELEQAVRTSAVELRGWDFPHYDYNSPPNRTSNYVEQSIDWRGFVELWRAYKSGQFVSISALMRDWSDASDKGDWEANMLLSVEDTIFRFVEIYEFASRWAHTLSFGEVTIIECTLRNLSDRALALSPRRGGFRINCRCTQDEWPYHERCQTSDLLSTPSELAITPAIQLLEIFGFDTTAAVVRDIQSELRT